MKRYLQRTFTVEYYRQPSFWGIILFVVICILLLNHCSSAKSNRKPPLSVVTALSRNMSVPIYIDALGLVTPTVTVTIKSRINGQLMNLYFREGQMIKKGDLLALIDPRPFQAQLTQYEGQLERDQALLANAQLDMNRYQKLWKQNSISKQILDTQVSLVKQDMGNVEVDKGLIEATKINIIYCNIISPIDGRIGLNLVYEGNYVQPSDTTGIAVITTLNPITVVFSIPEDSIPQVQQQINSGKTLQVAAYDRRQQQLLSMGTLLTIDNQIDPTTGMVKLKANFDNEKNMLFPNQFVNIRLVVTTLQGVTTVPTAAIQHSVQGSYVYLVDSANKAHIKNVVTGATTNDDTTITSGLLAGQTVVVEGADKLTEGVNVTIANAPHPATQKMPAKRIQLGYLSL